MKKSKSFIHNNDIVDIIYVDKTGIHFKLDYIKHGTYIITEVFTNVKVQVKKYQVNKK